MAQLGRHPYRPAHVHYLVTGKGFLRLVTHTIVGGDDYLATDAALLRECQPALVGVMDPLRDRICQKLVTARAACHVVLLAGGPFQTSRG